MPPRMVPLVTAGNSFEARVIAARLGSDGIVWQLRGAVDGPLAVGPVEVLVSADDLDLARELLLADDVEEALRGVADDTEPGASGGLWVVLVIAATAVFAVARMVSIV